MIAVDTSVLIDLFRGTETPAVRRLRQIENDEIPFRIPVVCCQEVLQGARHEKDWQNLDAYLSTQALVAPVEPWETHKAAARIYFDCRRQGLTIRSTVDCLIAQLVIESNDMLLHDDEDFERIKAVRPLRTLRG